MCYEGKILLQNTNIQRRHLQWVRNVYCKYVQPYKGSHLKSISANIDMIMLLSGDYVCISILGRYILILKLGWGNYHQDDLEVC